MSISESDVAVALFGAMQGDHTVVRVGDWSKPRRLYTNPAMISLEIGLTRCNCETCAERVETVKSHLEANAIPQLWIGSWLVLKKPEHTDVLKYLKKVLGLKLNYVELPR